MHAGAPPGHCELLTHWLLREQPLQHWSHTHGVSVGIGPQPAVTPLFLQHVPAQVALAPQHCSGHEHDCPMDSEHCVTHTLLLQPCPQPQLPQLTVRAMPQLSLALSEPQFFICREQKTAFVSGVQPHTFAVPPPMHVCGAVQVPQLAVRAMPQLSVPLSEPQFFPWREQKTPSLSLVQPHTLGVPPSPHASGAVHVPQLATVRMVAQLSLAVTEPQSRPSRVQKAGSFSGVQLGHTLGVTEPQVPTEHVPQLATLRVALQLSITPVSAPQFLPRRVHNAASVSGTHTQAPASQPTPEPPQAPQFAVRGAPQLSLAVTSPHTFASRVQKPPFDSGAQPQTLLTPPPPHVCGSVQGPQSMVRPTPQLSIAVTEPHCFMSREQKTWFVSLVQLASPHTPGIPPPPQVSGSAQSPQLATERVTPHRSSWPLTGPHATPSRAHSAASLSVQPPPPPPVAPPPVDAPPPFPPPVPPSFELAPSTQKPPAQCCVGRQSASAMQRPRVSMMNEQPRPSTKANSPGTRRRRTFTTLLHCHTAGLTHAA